MASHLPFRSETLLKQGRKQQNYSTQFEFQNAGVNARVYLFQSRLSMGADVSDECVIALSRYFVT